MDGRRALILFVFAVITVMLIVAMAVPSKSIERFDDATEIARLKTSVARVALAVREQIERPPEMSREAIGAVVRPAVQDATALLRDRIQAVNDDLGAYKANNLALITTAVAPIDSNVATLTGSVASLAGNLQGLEGKITTLTGSIMSPADRATLLQGLDSVKRDVTDLQANHVTFGRSVGAISASLTQVETALAAYAAAASRSHADVSGRLTAMDTSYGRQFSDVVMSVANMRSQDIVPMQTALADVVKTTEVISDVRAAFRPNGRLVLKSASGGYVTIDPALSQYGHPADTAFSVGATAAADGTGYVPDVNIVGDGDRFHALYFGGTMSEPAVSSILAERQLPTGRSELLLAKHGNGQPSKIHMHADGLTFTVPTTPKSVPSTATDAMSLADASNTILTIDKTGVKIGDFSLQPRADGLYACNKTRSCTMIRAV
jgi:hypothetical protein